MNTNCFVRSMLIPLIVSFLSFYTYADCKKTFYHNTEKRDYFSSAQKLKGKALHAELNKLIKEHTSYISASCIWEMQKSVSNSSLSQTAAMSIYGDNSTPHTDKYLSKKDAKDWVFEHVWPMTHGFSNKNKDAYTDGHNIRMIKRSKSFKHDDMNFLINECPECFLDGKEVNPPNEIKGNIARKLFYMDVRYSDVNDLDEPHLSLVDEKSNKDGEFGKLCTLLDWHIQNEPTLEEFLSNNTIENWQGNRNPFIDYPEFAIKTWGSKCEKLGHDLYEKGVDKIIEGNHQKAIKLLVNALSFELNDYGTNKIPIASLYNTLGDTYHAKNRIKNALSAYEKGLKLARGNKKTIAKINANIGRVYNSLRLPKKAIEYLDKALSIYNDIDKDNPNIAFVYSNLGYSYRMLNKLTDAESYIKLALETNLINFGKDSDVVIEQWLYLGDINKLLGKFVLAKEYLSLALKAYIKADNFSQLAITYVHLSRLSVELGEYDTAIKYLHESIDNTRISGQRNEGNAIAFRRSEIAEIYVKHLKEYPKGINYYESSLRYFNTLDKNIRKSPYIKRVVEGYEKAKIIADDK